MPSLSIRQHGTPAAGGASLARVSDLADELVQWLPSLAVLSVLILEANRARLPILFVSHLPLPTGGRVPPLTCTPRFYGTAARCCHRHGNVLQVD